MPRSRQARRQHDADSQGTCVHMPPVLKGAALYDALYAGGYHNELGRNLGQFLMYDAAETAAWFNVSTVLDVGCSNGLAVHELWTHGGLTASGVDVSAKAVEISRRHRLRCVSSDGPCALKADDALPPPKLLKVYRDRGNATKPPWPLKLGRRRCVEPCFSAAPATAIPFLDHSFDAVFSSDVLEHLPAEEVDAAVGELTRVARQFLFLKISNRKDQKGPDLPRLAQAGEAVPDTLHLTVRPQEFWLERFLRAGFILHHTLEDSAGFGWLRKNPHMCCSFVLRRRGVVPDLPQGVDRSRRRYLREQWWPSERHTALLSIGLPESALGGKGHGGHSEDHL
jgi:SAM-dependent methyltransferase